MSEIISYRYAPSTWYRVLCTLVSGITYVTATEPGWRLFAESAEPVVGLQLTAARAGPQDGDAGKQPTLWGNREVREHAPEGITRKRTSCREALRHIAARAGKDLVDCENST